MKAYGKYKRYKGSFERFKLVFYLSKFHQMYPASIPNARVVRFGRYSQPLSNPNAISRGKTVEEKI